LRKKPCVLKWRECRRSELLVSKLTLRSRVLLEKLIVMQLFKRFPALHGTWRFITLFTRDHHWFLSRSRCIQSTLSHPISLISTLILSSHLHLGLPNGLIPSGFLTKLFYAFLTYLILHLITLIIFGEAPHYAVFCSLPPLPSS
jgi:hypothetical protein